MKAQIRQTNFKNLNEMNDDEKFEFQKAFERELQNDKRKIKIAAKRLNN